MKNVHLLVGLTFFSVQLFSQSIQDYKDYDFVSGNKILFDDNLMNEKTEAAPSQWILQGGKALVQQENGENYISIKEYYTKIAPKIKSVPDTFTIEYDTWLDAGYDGNPGIEIHFNSGEQQIVITPNKHDLTASYPPDSVATKKNPEAYFGENQFYNRWVHISIMYVQKHLSIYLDQYKQIDIADCHLKPQSIYVSGNTSGDMKILLKNFRITTQLPKKAFELKNGKFITRAIKFDVNKSIVKPESMPVLKEVANYLKANPNAKFEIGGHTDSDGDDAANLKLSSDRAEAVKAAIIQQGIEGSRLTPKGFGETAPIDKNTTTEGKANNRRVEFVLQ